MTLLSYAAIFLLAGCATPDMNPQGQTHYHFEVPHNKGQVAAFSAVELKLAQIFTDYRAVLKFKQPESGTLLLGAVYTYPWKFGRICHSPYNLKVVVGDASVVMDFDLQFSSYPDSYFWPPAEELPRVEAQFKSISESVANSVSSAQTESGSTAGR